ncbi:MAG: NAD(P)/FAD-dependent oxidoreductase [Gammaproteobacteria bacterium]|nr:NAD(P)/FAD-dependent oxidoreductase [Gammaproteobacteria bacterium]
MTTECDVLIVGGGPAGSSLAWGLRKSGLNILIIDKQSFPRNKVCAGWVTPEVMQILDVDLDAYARENVLQSIDGFLTSSLGDKMVHTHYDDVVSFGIRRSEFDHYLLKRCAAPVIYGKSFKSMKRSGDSWLVNDEIKTRLIIGAGGHFCPVSRLLGTKNGKKDSIVTAQEIEFELTEEQQQKCSLKAEEPELYFLKDLSGYAWAFRKGEYINIGLGREDNHKLSEHVQDFVEHLKREGKLGFDLPDRFKGHAYILQNQSSRKIIDDGVMLIGDAVGLAYPQSGEGIRPAVESALIAADVIKHCDGKYDLSSLAGYRDRLHARFGTPNPNRRSWMPHRIKQALARFLLGNKWFSRRVVIDQWFLQRKQVPLQIE